MIRANPDTNALEPLLVRHAEMADDAMSVTFYLREGTKWSDGHPMTADDYVFMYEDAHWNDKVTTWNWIPQIKRAIKVDDYTVRTPARPVAVGRYSRPVRDRHRTVLQLRRRRPARRRRPHPRPLTRHTTPCCVRHARLRALQHQLTP